MTSMKTACLLISAAAIIGCGRPDYGDLGTVVGTVTLDGSPYANATVQFTPETGRPSIGATDSEGKYELYYIRDVKGALPGTHRVEISTNPVNPKMGSAELKFKEPLPKRYNSRSTLTAEVRLDANQFDFALQSR
ncbi:MAG: carboxypeptidase-like regulatory domain-containing protein [Blastopirellula sp. JB062]